MRYLIPLVLLFAACGPPNPARDAAMIQALGALQNVNQPVYAPAPQMPVICQPFGNGIICR